MEWLEESEKSLDSDMEIANEPDKIKQQLLQHKVTSLSWPLTTKNPPSKTVSTGKNMSYVPLLPEGPWFKTTY